MSVLIKEMKKPKTCGECDISLLVQSDTIYSNEIVYCLKMKTLVKSNEIRSDCPIVAEIPSKHGRMIYADRLYKKIVLDLCKGCQSNNCVNGIGCLIEDVFDMIEEFPTAIEGEG